MGTVPGMTDTAASNDAAPLDDAALVALACPIINACGPAFYFAPATAARGAQLGLDPVQFYALGRGGVLGDVEPPVVSAAFGYFNPGMVAGLWNTARSIVAPRVAGAAYMECCAEHGRGALADVAGLAGFVAAAEKVLAASDGDAFALFAGAAAEPAAADLPGRAMQLVTILREYRGSAHLVALRSAGVSSKDAHFVKRPADIGLFGWTDADAPTIDEALVAAMADAEALTDRLVAPAFAVLADDERAALVNGLQAIQVALGA